MRVPKGAARGGGAKPLECLVVGAPGSGKTALALGLMEALGYREVQIYHEDPGGRITSRLWPLAEARARLVGGAGRPPDGPATRGLQWATVCLPRRAGRPARELTIVDSTGIGPGTAADPVVRAAWAQTLRMLRRAQVVIHLVSPAVRGSGSWEGGSGSLDAALEAYCAGLPEGRYLALPARPAGGPWPPAPAAWTRCQRRELMALVRWLQRAAGRTGPP